MRAPSPFPVAEDRQKVLEFIEEEIEEPEKPEPLEVTEDKKEKENQNHAKETIS